MANIYTGPELVTTPVAIPSLRANFAWTFAGNVIYAGCQWGMLSTLAKLGNPSIVGQFTLGLAISAPVFMFTNLQLRAVQATDITGEPGFGSYFGLRVLSTLAGLLFVTALLPFAASSGSVRLVILLVSISKCFECMSDVTAGLLQREEQLKLVSISLMIRGIGSVIVFALSFAIGRNLSLSVAAMSLIWLAVVWFYDLPNVRRLTGSREPLLRFDRRELRRLAMLGLPLGWVATLSSLNTNIPRYFIQHQLGLADQGIFASLAYIVVAINLVVLALSQAGTTRLARLFIEAERKQFKVLLTTLTLAGVLIIIIGVPAALLVGRPFLNLVYGREYSNHVGLLAFLVGVTGVTTSGSFIFCGLTAARAFKPQLPIYGIATLVVFAASRVLIPHYGVVGGGIAILFSQLAIVIGGLWIIRRQLAGDSPKGTA